MWERKKDWVVSEEKKRLGVLFIGRGKWGRDLPHSKKEGWIKEKECVSEEGRTGGLKSQRVLPHNNDLKEEKG